MFNKKKILLLIISITVLLTVISVPILFFVLKKDDHGSHEHDYEYEEECRQPDYIEIEYQKIYKELISIFFKNNKLIERDIQDQVEKEIKTLKEKIGKGENFEREWNKTLTNENVTTEYELHEKKMFEQQNKTFYDIFYDENYEVLLKGGFLKNGNKNSSIKVKGYIEEEKPIHIAHFSMKINDNDDFISRKISSGDSIKIFKIINEMVNMSKKNESIIEKIKNEINLSSSSSNKIEEIDEIIDKKSLLNDDYKIGIYSELRKKEFYDEFEKKTFYFKENLIPHEIIFMLGDKKYILNDIGAEFCDKKNSTCSKKGFANYDSMPKKNKKKEGDKNEDYLIRNVIFNNFFKYGISKFNNETINFQIEFSDNDKEYEINSQSDHEEEDDDDSKQYKFDKISLFCNEKNLHFIYFLNNKSNYEDNVNGYINFKNDKKEKKKREDIIKNKIKNNNISKNKYDIFKYLLEITKFEGNSTKIEEIKKWFENKINSDNSFEEEQLKIKLEEYHEKIKFEEENKNKKIFNLIKNED